jgi:hypothetical protein
MAKLENFYFNNFTRVNEAVQAQSLKNEELQQLNNMRLDDDIASAVARKGFARYNQQVDTTGTINSLFDVKALDGDNYLLAQIGTKLRKSLNGTGAYSDIKTGLSGEKLRMAIYGENFFFTSEDDAPFYTDLVTNNDLTIETPDITGMTLTNNSVNPNPLTSARWRYILLYVDENGQTSNPSVRFEYEALANLTEGTLSHLIENIPVPSSANITSKRLYRTAANTLETYYLLATLDPSTTTYTDEFLDGDLLLPAEVEYKAPINSSKYICVNSERLFFANVNKAYTNRVIPPALVSGANFQYAGAGNSEAGEYTWALSYIDIAGNESALTEQFTDTILANYKIKIEDIAMPYTNKYVGESWNFNESIKSIRLYRTKKNTTSPFFLVSTTDVNDVVFSVYYSIYDDLPDASLGAEFPVADSNYLDTVDLNSSVLFSNLFSPTEIPELNLIQVYPDDNDPITGIFNDDNGIIVFKERSICKIYTNGDPTNWQVSKLVENIGCDAPNSIYKYGNSYFFGFENRIYIFDGRSDPKNISESLRNTWDTVTEVTGATFYNDGQFYIATVKIGSGYKMLCYDTKLDGWYNWTINKADDAIVRLFGTDKGKILVGGNTYVVEYNEEQDYDSDSGSRVDITVNLKTKDFIVDGFVNMRLMTLFIDYRKLLDRNVDSALFMLTDPTKITSNIKTYNDNSSTVVINKFKMPTDAMIGNLKRARVINFTFNGYSFDKFISARLDYMPEFWGVERRSPGVGEGLGISHGSEAGVSD